MIRRHGTDELDRALDLLVEGGTADASPRVQPMLQTAAAARAALQVEVPPDLANRHLAALSEIEVVPARQRWSRRKRVAVVLLAATLALGAMVETAAASSNALPGELLYPIKRAIEAVDLAIHRSATSRANLHLKFAHRRLQELNELLALRRAGQKVDIGAAMSAYSSEVADVEDAAGHVGSAAVLGHIEDELSKNLTVLADLRDKISSPQARDAIERAIERAENAQQGVKGQSKDHGKPSKAPSGPPPGRGKGSRGP